MKNNSGDGITVNLENGSGSAMASGSIQAFGSALFVACVTTIPDGEIGAALTCGVINLTVPGGTNLAQGANFPYNTTTQAYDAGGDNIGIVTEQNGNDVRVLLNGLPGGVG